MDLDQAAEELYAADPAGFVAKRTALAKHARTKPPEGAGDPELARRIQQLTKPTRAAWLVNLLARERTELIEQLADLADLLAEGMRTLSGPELQQLTQQRSALVSALTRTAVELGAAHGYRAAESVHTEVAQTLTAALADPQAAELVRNGRVSRALNWSGFGLDTGPAPARATDAEQQPAASSTVASVTDLDQHRRDTAIARARKLVERARQQQRRSIEGVTRSQRRVAEAEARAREAEQAAKAAREAVREKAAELKIAQRALEQATQAHERAARRDADETASLKAATAQLRRSRDEEHAAAERRKQADADLAEAETELGNLENSR